MEINTFGDSHARFSFLDFNNIKVKEHKWVGPWTMYRVGRDKPDFTQYIDDANSPLVVSFGEIDIRCHIHRFAQQHNEDDVITKLVSEYIQCLRLNKNYFRKIIISVPTPPCSSIGRHNDEEYPFVGSDEDRIRYHKKIVEEIKKYSNEFDVLDATNYYSDENGLLKLDLSDGHVHIKDTKYIEEELMKLLKEKKIAIGLNIFKPNKRQDLCIESLLNLKKKFPENIDLFNLQFKDDKEIYEHKKIKTLFELTEEPKDYIKDATKKLPSIGQLFDVLAYQDCDYFCFTNNDIIISDRYIKHILDTDYDTYPASRLAIQPIESFDDKIIPSHYQVAGFDTYTVNTKWWKDNRDKFDTYFLGMPAWDVDYATRMMLYSNCSLCNKWPPPIFHIVHESPWMDSNKVIPERVFNEDQFFKNNKKIADTWNSYLFNVLLKRSNEYRTPFSNEEKLEKEYFKL